MANHPSYEPTITLVEVDFDETNSNIFASRNDSSAVTYVGTESCDDAPTQCVDSGYNPMNYGCVEKTNPDEGVECKPRCLIPRSVPTSGAVAISSDCVLYYQIVVTGKLNVTGIPDANGILPKIVGGRANRFFKVESGGELYVTSLNLTGGKTDETSCNTPYSDCGGGVAYVNNAIFRAEDSHFIANGAYYGGAVFGTNGATIDITNSSLKYNSAVELGGAICMYGTGVVCAGNCTGSGVAAGTLAVTDGAIGYNKVTSATGKGGGMYCSYSIVAINATTIEQNEVLEGGGGAYIDYSITSFSDSVLENNDGGKRGGGIYAGHGELNMTSTSLINNTVKSGGGIYAYSANSATGTTWQLVVTIRRSTFTGNSANSTDASARGGSGVLILIQEERYLTFNK